MYERTNQSNNNSDKRNVTYIDDLPDLEDLEDNIPFQNRGNVPAQYQKFIRNPMGSPPPPPQSGMNVGNQQHYQEFFTPPPPPPPPPQLNHDQQTHMRPSSDSPSCLEIADHVNNCPICSRFYKTDNTVYIIAIVILSIICIMLLKKVLNL